MSMQTEARTRVVGADRVLAVLTELATYPEGVSLDELTNRMGQNKATVHHALTALLRAGLASRAERGHYVLGDEFLRLAFTHYDERPEDARVRPLLQRLVDRFGETAHYATLDHGEIVYRAKLDPTSNPVRLTSTIGGRNPAHSTGVGKALLAATLPDLEAVRRWIGDRSLVARTKRTAVTAEELHARLEQTRVDGFAVDDRENEDVINCIAFPLYLAPGRTPSGAISVSALAYRTPLSELRAAADEIRAIIGDVVLGLRRGA